MTNLTYKVVSAMKQTKDHINSQYTEANITETCAAIAATGATHIEVACPLATDAQYATWSTTPTRDAGSTYTDTALGHHKQWCDEARDHGLKVMHTGVLLGQEIPNGEPYNVWGAPVQHARATTTISGDAVNAVVMVKEGWDYPSAPAVTFSGGGGTGAAGTAVLTAGKVTSVTVDDGGSGYTSAPAIQIEPLPPGTAASAPTDGATTWLGRIYDYITDSTSVTTTPSVTGSTTEAFSEAFKDGDIFAPMKEVNGNLFNESGQQFFLKSQGIQANVNTFWKEMNSMCNTYWSGQSKTIGITQHYNFSELISGWMNGGADSQFDDYDNIGVDYYGNSTDGNLTAGYRSGGYNADLYVQHYADVYGRGLGSGAEKLWIGEVAMLKDNGQIAENINAHMRWVIQWYQAVQDGLVDSGTQKVDMINYWGGWDPVEADGGEAGFWVDGSTYKRNAILQAVTTYHVGDGLKRFPKLDANSQY